MKIRANFLFCFGSKTSSSSTPKWLHFRLLFCYSYASLSHFLFKSPEGVPCSSDFRYLPTMNDGWSDFLLAESGCRCCMLSTWVCTLCFWETLNAPDALQAKCVVFLVQCRQRSLLRFEQFYVMSKLAFLLFLLLLRDVELRWHKNASGRFC